METVVEDVDLNLEVSGDETMTITGSVTVNRNCGDCGTTLKANTFDVEQEVSVPDDVDEKENIDWGSLDLSDHMLDESESGGGRYAANMVGFEGTCTITGKRTKPLKDGDDTVEFEVSIQDACKASEYEEQV